MTLDELIVNCQEAESFQDQVGNIEPANFNVFIDGYRYGRRVRIAPGLMGVNLGHYPPKGTMVNLKTADVRSFIEKAQSSPTS